jgi:glycosyltransferase involved in cell wall biosynthesis
VLQPQAKPALSVVTIVKNDYDGLSRSIESVKEQSGLNIQHIIVDGGSTDGSAGLAKTASDVEIESRPDGGIYRAMQRGYEAALGDYLIFTNAGDALFGKHFLAQAVGELRNSNSGWGFGPLIEESQRGTTVWTPVDGEISLSQIADRKTYIPFPTVICSRELIAKVNGFNFTYEIAGDFDLILRLAKEELPIRWDYPIARFAAGGISYSKAPKAWSEERTIRKENLGMTRIELTGDFLNGLRKIARWKLGKFLDVLHESGVLGKNHWRDRRAPVIPERYKGLI